MAINNPTNYLALQQALVTVQQLETIITLLRSNTENDRFKVVSLDEKIDPSLLTTDLESTSTILLGVI